MLLSWDCKQWDFSRKDTLVEPNEQESWRFHFSEFANNFQENLQVEDVNPMKIVF